MLLPFYQGAGLEQASFVRALGPTAAKGGTVHANCCSPIGVVVRGRIMLGSGASECHAAASNGPFYHCVLAGRLFPSAGAV